MRVYTMMLSLLTLLLGFVAASTAATGGASLTATTVKSYENDTVTLPCRVEDLGECAGDFILLGV